MKAIYFFHSFQRIASDVMVDVVQLDDRKIVANNNSVTILGDISFFIPNVTFATAKDARQFTPLKVTSLVQGYVLKKEFNLGKDEVGRLSSSWYDPSPLKWECMDTDMDLEAAEMASRLKKEYPQIYLFPS